MNANDPRPVAALAIPAPTFARREPTVEPDASGQHVLGHPPAFRLLVAGYASLSTALLVLGCLALQHDRSGLILVASLFGGMWIASLNLFLDVFAVTLYADERGLVRKAALRAERRLAWREVEAVDHSEAFHRVTFRTAGGPALRVSLYRNGLASLTRLAEAGLAPDVADEARISLSPHPRRAA